MVAAGVVQGTENELVDDEAVLRWIDEVVAKVLSGRAPMLRDGRDVGPTGGRCCLSWNEIVFCSRTCCGSSFERAAESCLGIGVTGCGGWGSMTRCCRPLLAVHWALCLDEAEVFLRVRKRLPSKQWGQLWRLYVNHHGRSGDWYW